jgi:hypothetical protein
MHLTEQEVERFYGIWFPLLHYVNQKLKLVPEFPEKWRTGVASPEVAVKLRNALWQNDRVREAFIDENPAQLTKDDLALVAGWQHRVAGNFFIFRHLKKYSVFIDTETPPHGYGVTGITDSIVDMVGPYLPVYVEAVLIPFEDRIIYDSLLAPYNMYFGSGYRSSLKDAYRDIQERDGIITTLPSDHTGSTDTKIQAGNRKVLMAFQKAAGVSGLSPKMIQEHTDNIAHFASEFLIKQTPPRLLVNLTQHDIEAYQESHNGKVNLVSFKRFVWFLRDTARIDWEEAEKLLNFLKQK